jgi:hypothetical protein
MTRKFSDYKPFVFNHLATTGSAPAVVKWSYLRSDDLCTERPRGSGPVPVGCRSRISWRLVASIAVRSRLADLRVSLASGGRPGTWRTTMLCKMFFSLI